MHMKHLAQGLAHSKCSISVSHLFLATFMSSSVLANRTHYFQNHCKFNLDLGGAQKLLFKNATKFIC